MKYNRSHNQSEEASSTRKLKTKPLVVLIAILFICNIIWFVAWLIPNKPKLTDEEVALVAGESITREEWLLEMEKEVGRKTLLDLVNGKVMDAAATKYKIDVSEKEIDLELALIQSVDGQSYAGLDGDKARQMIRSNLILDKVLTKDVVITDEAVNANYDDNTSLYNVSTAYRTSVIILQTEEEANQTLGELSDGSSFDVLAKERSIDLISASLGGDIGYINGSNQNVDKAIADVAAKTKEGTTSGVIVLSNDTYAIIQVSDIIKGQSFKLKEVEDYIRRQLALEQLPESVSPEAFWKEFDAKWFYGE